MLKKISLLFCVGASLAWGNPGAYQPQQGDVVFQSSPNPMGMDLVDMIEGATGSVYSHCGMVIWHQNQWHVIEAVGPVQIISLTNWQARGRGKKIWAYRLQESSQQHIPAAITAMKRDIGKPYDSRYRLDDAAIYCSELIYRGWKFATGKGLGKTVILQELNWQPYRKIIVVLEGSEQIPLTREIITPRDLAKAPELTRVWPVAEVAKKKAD
jgi:hypothetical protein